MADEPNFNNFLTSPIEEIKNIIEENHYDYFGSVEVGDVRWNYIEYPLIQIVPDELDYDNRGKYNDSVIVNFYFERGLASNKYLDHASKVEEVIEDIYDVLGSYEFIGDYKFYASRPFGAEVQNTHLIVIETEFVYRKVLDIGN